MNKKENNKLINLTPHAINIYSGDEVVMSLAPSGVVPRCEVIKKMIDELKIDDSEIPVYKTNFGKVTDLPEKKNNTYYIVSRAVAEAMPNRDDLIFPNESVRDSDGRIIGCRSFASASNIVNKVFTLQNGQKLVTIPRKSSIVKDDYVLIKKVEVIK